MKKLDVISYTVYNVPIADWTRRLKKWINRVQKFPLVAVFQKTASPNFVRGSEARVIVKIWLRPLNCVNGKKYLLLKCLIKMSIFFYKSKSNDVILFWMKSNSRFISYGYRWRISNITPPRNPIGFFMISCVLIIIDANLCSLLYSIFFKYYICLRNFSARTEMSSPSANSARIPNCVDLSGKSNEIQVLLY